MADPLSIASGIAGLLALTDIVFDRLIKYGKSVKNAEKEIRQLADEVNLLGGTLNSLARLADSVETKKFDSKLRTHHIEACNNTLAEINMALKKHDSSTAKRNSMWPFTSRHVADLTKDLSRHKGTITLALSANSMEAMLQLLGQDQVHTAEIVAAVKDNTKITSRIREDLERRKVLDYYLKLNPQSNYDMSLRLRHPGTGLWLKRLPEFQHWLSESGSMLWLKGIPGAGKTVLAGAIIEETLNRSTEIVSSAFFFCDYKDDNTHNPETILRALVYQLAIQKEEAYTILEHHYQVHNPETGLPKAPSVESLSAVLQVMIRLYDHVFLTVDGIDECGKHTEEVLETLTAIFKETDNISMALLSRDEDDIHDWLEEVSVSIEIAAHKEDVSEYVRAQLGDRIRRRKLRLDDPTLKGEILERLVKGSKGIELLSIPKAGNTLKPNAIIRESSITKYCSSLLRKSTDGSTLEFSHFSVLEFLEGNLAARSDLDKFYVSKSRAEVLLAIEYLKYLQLDNIT
ncbi:hypothetical protein PG987_016491 [Apiospora arundinis]